VRDTANRLLRTGEIEALPTFFEHLTAIAMVAFRDARVELAILETGLGGRLDATTAVEASVCAITDIGFDHEEYLGNTIESIAAEKAAIIHEGSTAVIAPQTAEALKVILDRCQEVNVTPLFKCAGRIEEVSKDGRCKVTFETQNDTYENVWLGLRGRHQIENASVAIQLAEVLRARFPITRENIVEGLETALHPGRLELFGDNPAFLLDGAHNPSGAQALQEFLQKFGRHPLTIIFGTMRDKRIDQIAEYLFPLADDLILTEIDNPRSASISRLLEVAKKLRRTNVTATTTSRDALKLAIEKTPAHGMICITGSLYLIGEIRTDVRHSEKRMQKTT
jgi:dihydrofolate synthase/folylpolyglutamate synthase